MPCNRNWFLCSTMNAYFTPTAWQSTWQPYFFRISRSSLALLRPALSHDTSALRVVFSSLTTLGCSLARRTRSYRLLSEMLICIAIASSIVHKIRWVTVRLVPNDLSCAVRLMFCAPSTILGTAHPTLQVPGHAAFFHEAVVSTLLYSFLSTSSRACAAGSEDAGFCPVIKRPSVST